MDHRRIRGAACLFNVKLTMPFKQLTIQVGTTLLEILERQYPYVDEMLRQDKR